MYEATTAQLISSLEELEYDLYWLGEIADGNETGPVPDIVKRAGGLLDVIHSAVEPGCGLSIADHAAENRETHTSHDMCVSYAP